MSSCPKCGAFLKWAKVPVIELGFDGGNVTERETFDLVEYCPNCDLGEPGESDTLEDQIPF